MKFAHVFMSLEALADILKLSDQNIQIDGVSMTTEGDLRLSLSGIGLPIGCTSDTDRVRMVYETMPDYGMHQAVKLLVKKYPQPDPKEQYLRGNLTLSQAAEAVLADRDTMKKAAVDYLVSNNTI